MSGGPCYTRQSPSRVEFDGGGMNKEAFLGLDYSREISEPYSATHSFTYVNNDGKTFTNQATLVPVTNPEIAAHVSLQGFSFSFGGAPAAANDTFEIDYELDGASGSSIGEVTADVTPGTNTGTVSKDHLSYLQAGHGTMQIVRTRKSPLQQGTSGGGEIDASYYSTRVSVTLQ